MLRRNTSQLDLMRILIGFALAMLFDLLSAIGLTVFIYNEYLNENHIVIWAFITHFLAAFIGTYYASNGDKKTAVIRVAVVSGAYYLIQLIASMLLFDGAMLRILPLICVVAMSGCCALVISNKSKKSVRRRRKHH